MSDEWQEMDAAPKDRQILLDVGLPWPVVGAYNTPNGDWHYASFQIGMYNGQWCDSYYEDEQHREPKCWRELPKLRGQE